MATTPPRRRLLLRQLHQLHKLSGTVCAVVVLIWFVSGIVMVFSRFPHANNLERRAFLLPIQPQASLLSIAQVAAKGVHLPAENTLIQSPHGIAIYVYDGEKVRKALRADSAEPAGLVPREALPVLVQQGRPNTVIESVELLDSPDRWTVYPGLAKYFPLHKVHLADEPETDLYFSARSGELVQQSTQTERAWAYVGAIPHWFYFKPLRGSSPWWRAVILWLTALAAVAALSGWVLGFLRTARTLRNSRDLSPFRLSWFRWHHLTGLVFGPVVFTWLLSGALSLEPFAWKSLGRTTPPSMSQQWQGGSFNPSAFSQSVNGLLTLCRDSLETVVELAPRQVMKRPYQLCFGKTESLLAWQENGSLKQAAFVDTQTLEAALRGQGNDAPVTIQLIADGDSLEVQRRHEVLNHNLVRVNWPNSSDLTVYVDRASAQVTAVYDSRDRLERWLYHGLHNLDFPALYRHPDLWLFLILALLLGGTVLSLSACRLAMRPWCRMGAPQRTRNSP